MKFRSEYLAWLLFAAFAVLSLGLGCAQRGDIGPTEANRSALSFLETVTVNPDRVAPHGTASVEARVVGETNDPVAGEAIRFIVSRGAICITHADTTVETDSLGYAYATFTAPPDTGNVELRTELQRMRDLKTTTIHVVSTP